MSYRSTSPPARKLAASCLVLRRATTKPGPSLTESLPTPSPICPRAARLTFWSISHRDRQGTGPEPGEPWAYIATAAAAVDRTDLEVNLSFYPGPCGERGAIANISEKTLTVGTLFRAAFENMAENYYAAASRIWPDVRGEGSSSPAASRSSYRNCGRLSRTGSRRRRGSVR